jgi:GH3 auxin-responsive promoter
MSCDTGKSHVVLQGDSVLPLSTGGTAIEHVIAVGSANANDGICDVDFKKFDYYRTSSSNARDHTTNNGLNSSNTVNNSTDSIDALSLMTDADKARALLLVKSSSKQLMNRPTTLHSSISKTLHQTAPTTAMYLDTVEMMNVYGDVAIDSGQLSPIQSKKELQLGFIPSSSIIVSTADGKMINSSNIARVYCSILVDLSKQGTEDIVYNNSTRLSDYIIHRYAFFDRHSSHIITDIENGSVNIHLLPLCSSIQDRKLLEGIKIKPNMARAQMLKLACDALGFTNRSKHIWPPDAVYSSNITGTTGGSVCTTQQIEQLSNEAGDNVFDGDGVNSITSSSLISVLTPVSRKHKVASNFTTASDKESTSGSLLKCRASVADSEAATTSSSLAYMIKCLPSTTSASFTKLQCSQGLRYLCEHAACGHVSVTCTAAEVSVLLFILHGMFT